MCSGARAPIPAVQVRAAFRRGDFEDMEVLVKCSAVPRRMPRSDDVLSVKGAEVRPAWRRPGVGLQVRCVAPAFETQRYMLLAK